jgi:hypothetical protein
MKFGELTSIAHNIADSFACGNGFLIGLYYMDVFDEATKSPEGYILVDFIAGTSSGAQPSASLAKGIALYAQALDELCQKHGATADAFRELTVRYSLDVRGRRFVVTVEDRNGRRSTDEYLGWAGKRPMEVDDRGRVRRKRDRTSQKTK